MSFTKTSILEYNKLFYSIGAEVTGGSEEVILTYTATGINYGGREIGDVAEIVFSITCDSPQIQTNCTSVISVQSTDADEILAQAESELQKSLG